MRRFFMFAGVLAGLCSVIADLSVVCSAQELRVPESVTAGDDATISAGGSGKGTFYLVGPGVSRKSDVNLGEDIHISGQDLRNAGAYLAIVCSSSCESGTLYVTPAKPYSLAFIVHPSRVPVGRNDAVNGVAFPFDEYHNLVRIPVDIDFELSTGKSSQLSHSARTQEGAAWFRTSSGKSAGTLKVTASVGDISAQRAVQQVASDPCNLRITGGRTKTGIVVQTEPVHDCAGNPVPDGTIVTFTAEGSQGKVTVDAPIKQGIARAEMEGKGAETISVASGVVMGNELRIGAEP
jgi:hypothetical protein